VDPLQASFTYTGIGVFVSREELDESRFTSRQSAGGFNVYRAHAPLLKARVKNFRKSGDGSVVLDGPLGEQTTEELEELEGTDDIRRFKFTASTNETLLFISEQYHPQWTARSNGRSIRTAIINDFYLGAFIPPGASEVELSFRPFVLWSWIGQVFYAVLAVWFAVSRAYSARILFRSRSIR